MLHRDFTAACVIGRELLPEFYIVEIGILDLSGSCDLDHDQMTFIYELEPYCWEIHGLCKYKLPTSRLSKVII